MIDDGYLSVSNLCRGMTAHSGRCMLLGTSLSGVEVKLDRWMRSTKSNDSKSDVDDAPSTSDLPSRLHSLLSRKLHPNKIG